MDINLQKALQLHQNSEFAAAEDEYKNYIKSNPDNADAHIYLGIALYEQEKLDQSETTLNKAIKLNPNNPEAFHNLGIVYEKRHLYARSEELFSKAISITPHFKYFYNLSNQLYRQNKYEQAIVALEKAINLNPQLVQAYINLANIMFKSGKLKTAEDLLRQALKIDPNYSETYDILIKTLNRAKKLEEAIEYFNAKSKNCSEKAKIYDLTEVYQAGCCWKDLEKAKEKALEEFKSTGEDVFNPFTHITLFNDLEENLRVAKNRCKEAQDNTVKTGIKFDFSKKSKDKDKLNIGYVSADLREHTVGIITQHLFSQHDKNAFNINIYHATSDDGSDVYKAIKGHATKYIDCSALSDIEMAERIYEDDIDILLDMSGHTEGHRLGALAFKPAPIIINFLGFTGSTGANFIDYIVADRVVIPEEQQEFYTEKCLYFPESLQFNHPLETISESATKADLGLPEDKFLFSAVHQNYKVNEEIFKIWCGLLTKKSDSVLCFRASNTLAEKNLKNAAEKNQVDPKRLVFLDNLPSRELYFKRLNFMDLGLDTPIYNGGSTTMDMLWAGVPVVTKIGNHYPSRMGAGLINAIGMYDDLVVNNMKEYEELADKLANNIDALKKLKKQLWQKRTTTPLFNNSLYVKTLENGLKKIWQNYIDGNDPKVIDI